MSLKQRINSGGVYTSASGTSLLESLWHHLLCEWRDPDDSATNEFDAGYVSGLAYAIAKIEQPYVDGETRIEDVIERARNGGDDL